MTPSMTACPPTSVSSPLSSTGSIWIWALMRKKLRMDKWIAPFTLYREPAAGPGRYNEAYASVAGGRAQIPPAVAGSRFYCEHRQAGGIRVSHRGKPAIHEPESFGYRPPGAASAV